MSSAGSGSLQRGRRVDGLCPQPLGALWPHSTRKGPHLQAGRLWAVAADPASDPGPGFPAHPHMGSRLLPGLGAATRLSSCHINGPIAARRSTDAVFLSPVTDGGSIWGLFVSIFSPWLPLLLSSIFNFPINRRDVLLLLSFSRWSPPPAGGFLLRQASAGKEGRRRGWDFSPSESGVEGGTPTSLLPAHSFDRCVRSKPLLQALGLRQDNFCPHGAYVLVGGVGKSQVCELIYEITAPHDALHEEMTSAATGNRSSTSLGLGGGI